MLDCQVTVQENAFIRYLNTGEIPCNGYPHPVSTPFQVFETGDGYVSVALKGGGNDQWPLFCALIDRVDLSMIPGLPTAGLAPKTIKYWNRYGNGV